MVTRHNTNLQVEDYIDTKYDRWIVSEMDNHQLVWVVLKYQFNETRPVISDEEEEENHDHKHESDE